MNLDEVNSRCSQFVERRASYLFPGRLGSAAMSDRENEVVPFSIERLPDDARSPEAGRGVMLSGRDASQIVDCVGGVAKAGGGWLARKRAFEGLYRIVPDDELREGLLHEGFRYVTPSAGDASVQLVDRGGKFVGRAELRAAGPSAMKLIGPAAWQAMAMATQQHYLVEISARLSAIDGKLGEVLARDDDRKVSLAEKARVMAGAVQATLSTGALVTPQRREELSELLRRVDDDWRELWARTDRLLKAYEDAAGGEEAAGRVNDAWSQLLRATQALAETSTAYIALPQDDPRTAEALRREESERIAGGLANLRELAERLHTAHAVRQAKRTVHDLSRTSNPVERVRRKVTGSALPPGPGGLDPRLAAIARELAEPVAAPQALLVDVRRDGTALVATEPE
jgi:hypothetical protein